MSSVDPQSMRICRVDVDLHLCFSFFLMSFSHSRFSSTCLQPTLNLFMTLGKPTWTATRLHIQKLLSASVATLRDNKDLLQRAIFPVSAVKTHLPANIGDYTDFYASKEHATNVGIMFRGKENALMPNWTHLPVGYHGRASSIVVSGTELKRPQGQRVVVKGEAPQFGPSLRMDCELEMVRIESNTKKKWRKNVVGI